MKILLALDASNFNKEQLPFPAYLARLAEADITALFLENVMDVNEPLSKYSYLEGFYNPYERESEVKKKIIEENVQVYKQACVEMGLSGNLLRARGIPDEDTIEASRFSDLLLISSALSFYGGSREAPTIFAENVLSAAQCPVIFMPDSMQEIKEVFFAYNGGSSSVYAIRQFTHLFPLFKTKKITVLYVPENDDTEIAHERHIKEYLYHHYKKVDFRILIGNPSSAILSHLSKQKDCMVTFGAYGRSKFSQFFKKSKAENILKELDMPVFITHF